MKRTRSTPDAPTAALPTSSPAVTQQRNDPWSAPATVLFILSSVSMYIGARQLAGRTKIAATAIRKQRRAVIRKSPGY